MRPVWDRQAGRAPSFSALTAIHYGTPHSCKSPLFSTGWWKQLRPFTFNNNNKNNNNTENFVPKIRRYQHHLTTEGSRMWKKEWPKVSHWVKQCRSRVAVACDMPPVWLLTLPMLYAIQTPIWATQPSFVYKQRNLKRKAKDVLLSCLHLHQVTKPDAG